jgi:hypothetical protein
LAKPQLLVQDYSGDHSQDIQSVLFSRSAWKDIVLEPSESLGAQSWLVVFTFEVNLPEKNSAPSGL